MTDWFLGFPPSTSNGSPAASNPTAPRTLRDLFPNFDFSGINSTAGGGSAQARQAFLDMMRQAGYDPNGSMGAYQLMGGNSGGGDNGGGTGDYYQGPNGEVVSSSDIAGFQGQQGRWGSAGFLGQDRGDYNRYANDLGQLQYDPQQGIFAAPGSVDFSEGSRYNTNINHDILGTEILGAGAVGAGLAGLGTTSAATNGLADSVDGLGVPASSAGSEGMVAPINGSSAAGLGDPELGMPGLATDGSSTGLVPQSNDFLSTLRTGNQFRSGASFLNSLLNSGSGVNNGGGNMSGLTDILGLLNSLHGSFGNGVGTTNGALNSGQNAADRADPFGADNPSGQRGFYANYLKQNFPNLISTDPAAIRADPAYQFQLDSGTDAINRGAAAGGTLNSGNRLADLERYGQGLATNFTNQQFARNQAILGNLGTLSGATTSNPGVGGAALAGAFDNASNIRNNGINQLLSRGNVNGLGSLLGLLGNGISSGSSWLSNLFGSGGDGAIADVFPPI